MSSGADGGLIWARPEPGARRPRFSRDKIAAAALEIADSEGFEAVSMRRIASTLGAATMTLYNYVRTKDDLLALMHDAIMAEVLVPADELPADWREAVAASARRVRASLMRHQWAVGSLQEAQFGPNAMRRFEQFLAAVSGAGLSLADTFDLLSSVNAYVFGHALITVESQKRAQIAAADPAVVEETFAFAKTLMETGQFPHTARLMAGIGTGEEPIGPPMGEQGLEEQFERGLAAMIDGMARRFGIADREGER